MSITIDLQPEIERGLQAQAQAKGVSLAEYVSEIVAREARWPAATPVSGKAAVVTDGPFRVISGPPVVTGDILQSIEEIRAERDRHNLGLG